MSALRCGGLVRLLAVLWAMARCAASLQQPSAGLTFTPDQLWRFIEQAVKTEIQPLITKLETRIDTLDSRLYALDSRLDSKTDVLDSRLDAVAVQLQSYSFEPEGLITRLDGHKSQLDILTAKVDSQQSQLDRQTTKLDSQQSQLTEQAVKLDSQQSQLDGQAAKLDGQQSQLTEQAAKLESQQSQLDGQATKLDSQQSQLDGQASKLDSQQSQLAGQASKLDSQQSQLDGQATKLDSQQSHLAVQATKLDSQQAQLAVQATKFDSRQLKVNGLAAKLDSQQSQLDRIATDIDHQNSRVDDLAIKIDSQQVMIDNMSTNRNNVRNEFSTSAPPPRDCSDLPAGTQSGVYLIQPSLSRPVPVAAYCDLDTDGGNWTVFQRRADIQPRQDFYLDWAAYREGFGELDAEFWWGLQHLWTMTSSRDRRYELRINMEDFDGEKRHAVYQGFRISSERDGYRLSAANYTGNATDSLKRHFGLQFSTKDRDNDMWSRHCAQYHKAAWWYKDCWDANLNGQYLSGFNEGKGGVGWEKWRGWQYSLKTVEMKVRPSRIGSNA